MKKLLVALAGTVLSISYFLVNSTVFAHGTHRVVDMSRGASKHNQKYRFVTPTGTDITVDFTTNPFIAKE
jgi:hypothetical protein